jgi:hypothetical protein
MDISTIVVVIVIVIVNVNVIVTIVVLQKHLKLLMTWGDISWRRPESSFDHMIIAHHG